MELNLATIELTLRVYLAHMRERLDEAASIAKAAKTCAENGNVAKASKSRSMSNNCRTRSTPSSTPRA